MEKAQRPRPHFSLYDNCLSLSTQVSKEWFWAESDHRREDAKAFAREAARRKMRGLFQAMLAELKLLVGAELQGVLRQSPLDGESDLPQAVALRAVLAQLAGRLAAVEQGRQRPSSLARRLRDQSERIAALRSEQQQLLEQIGAQGGALAELGEKLGAWRDSQLAARPARPLLRITRQQLEESAADISLNDASIVELLMDEQGFLLNAQGTRMLDDQDQPVRLKEEDIAYLRANNLYEEVPAGALPRT